jgi:hypothetical protein
MVFRNEAVKILLPEELKSRCWIKEYRLVSQMKGLKVLNRAEDAVKEASPIFVMQ